MVDDVKSLDILYLKNKIGSGGNWFYWIAALSLINSIIVLVGGNLNFIIGLGATQFIDAFGQYYGGFFPLIAFVLDVLIAGVFVLFGFFSGKGSKWAFVVGMVVYALDGLVFLIVDDLLSMGFHLLALYFIFGGLKAALDLGKLPKKPAIDAPAPTIFIDAPKGPELRI
jgi:hypothetical protein